MVTACPESKLTVDGLCQILDDLVAVRVEMIDALRVYLHSVREAVDAKVEILALRALDVYNFANIRATVIASQATRNILKPEIDNT